MGAPGNWTQHHEGVRTGDYSGGLSQSELLRDIGGRATLRLIWLLGSGALRDYNFRRTEFTGGADGQEHQESLSKRARYAIRPFYFPARGLSVLPKRRDELCSNPDVPQC